MRTSRLLFRNPIAGEAIVGYVIVAALAAVALIGITVYNKSRHVEAAQRLASETEAQLNSYDDGASQQLRDALLNVRAQIHAERSSITFSKVKAAEDRLMYLVKTLPKGTPDTPLAVPLIVVYLSAEFDHRTGQWRNDFQALCDTWYLQNASSPPGPDGTIVTADGHRCRISQGPFGPYYTKNALRLKLQQLGVLDQFRQFQ